LFIGASSHFLFLFINPQINNNSFFMKKYNGFIGLLLFCAFMSPEVTYAALPSGFETEVLADGLVLPTALTFSSDGRMFIAEKDGTVRLYKNGALEAVPVIRLTDINNYGDRGLIGIAADPNFAVNGYLYLSYTYENTPGANFSGPKTGRIVRITVVGDIASESSKVVLVGSVGGNISTPSCQNFATTDDCIPSDSSSHTVGGLRFGPDGKLYASLGDGASFDYVDPNALHAQNLDSLAGKMLRINTDGTAPSDNPFYNGSATANRSKVYAYGLRNMFRFNFKPGTTQLYGGDVGWNTWEEINKIVKGGNYGWPCREGTLPTAYGCTAAGALDPLYAYPHDANGAGSVTAGAFPTGTAYPAQYANTFFFGDYAQNWIKQMKVSTSGAFLSVSDFASSTDSTNGPVEFITGPEGNIYFIAIYTGEVKRITHTLGNRRPIVAMSGSPLSGLAPLTVNFSSAGTNDPDGNPITYLWNFGDGSGSSIANPSHVFTQNGIYNTVLTVRDNKGGVETKSITVTVGNRAPSAVITTPVAGSLYVPGEVLTLSGSGNDAEDGALPSTALSWRVILHHNTHVHILETYTGNNIPFTGPDHSDPSVFTEIELTVTDSGGLRHTTSVNIYLNNGSTQGGNLIQNSSFEATDPLNNTQPKGWAMDWWGNLEPIFTYPVLGFEGTGSRAAELKITQYTAGEAKWAFSPAFIDENTLYTFADHYTSSVPTRAVLSIGFGNGTHAYTELATLPASSNWNTYTASFTTPQGAQTASVLHVLDRVGTLTTDAFSLVKGNPDPDTIVPIVNMSAPLNGATVSGSLNIAATASDNILVAGVQFMVDGVVVGVEDTSAPYDVTLMSGAYANGTHTLSARARDAAGNVGTSTLVTITVNNTAGTNLMSNPSFEESNGTDPIGWVRDAWGVNTTTHTYLSTGRTGGKSVAVKINTYTDGDAKWFPADIAVTPGVTYTYSDWYKADDISDIIGRYTFSNGSVQYVGVVKELVPTTEWKQASGSFLVPSGVVSMTFMHLISSLATLTIDDASLVSGGGGGPDVEHPDVTITAPSEGASVSGVVNVTATAIDNVGVVGVQFLLDGISAGAEDATAPYAVSVNTSAYANGAHSLSARARDAAGNIWVSSPISITVNNSGATTTNLIDNPSLENIDGSGDPVSWFTDIWDQNNAVFTYPVTGVLGGKAANVSITNYISGDAKWYFTQKMVVSGRDYIFSDYYRSDVTTHVFARYGLSNGTFIYVHLGTALPSADWTQWTAHVVAPMNAVSLTVFHVLSSVGALSTDEYSLVSA
jgi:glucose/arabinose dehydrogenase